MNSSIYQISFFDLLWISIPVIVVLGVFYCWSVSVKSTVYGMARMVIQLLTVGYALNYIFSSNQPFFVLAILCFMLAAAGVISLRPVQRRDKSVYAKAFFSIAAGGIFTLIIVIKAVLDLTPWFEPRYIIPIAGMIFANSMNAVSLAAERFETEFSLNNDYIRSRTTAFRTALIPITNSLFAVGLVSLPGMMTGQILSGTSPLIAVRYQIMVMCMVFGSAGISAAMYLYLIEDKGKR